MKLGTLLWQKITLFLLKITSFWLRMKLGGLF